MAGRDPGGRLVLLSHRAFAHYEEAQHSAQAAYPGTRIERPAEPDEEARPRSNLLGTALAVVVLIAVLRRAWRSRSAGNG